MKILSGPIVRLFAGNYAIFGFSNVFFFLAPYLSLKGFSPSLTGWIVGVFFASSAFVKPLAGALVEKLGARNAMVLAGLLGLAGGMGLALSPDVFAALFLLRLVMGISFGIFLVALMAYQNVAVTDSERGASFAVTTIGSMLPMFTLIPLCDLAIGSGHFFLYLLIPAMMGGLCSVVAFSLDKTDYSAAAEKQEGRVWGSYTDLLREVPIVKLCISVISYAFADAAIVYIASLAVSRGLTASFFMVAFAAGSIFMRSAGRSYFNRTPRVLILGPAMVCMGISIFFATAVSNNILFALAGLLYGLGVGYGFPAILSLGGDLAPMYLRPKVMSFILFFMDLSWFLLPLYMGYVSDLSDITVAYRGLALVSVVMGIAVYILWSGTYVRMSGNGG